MSILSTNTKLIKVGQDYSAGSGISIDDKVISVTGEFGKTYSAGENISIYNQGEQLYISSKDWTNDIANASANAYNEAISQIPAPFDPSFISGQVDNKLDTTAFTNWQNGQYTTDLQTIEGQINNKLDESSFSQVSGSFLTTINIPESATWNEVSQAYEQASATYLTSISIPESAVWQDVSTTVQSNSAQWAEGGSGDEEVNSFVYNNSATINEVNTAYQSNSSNYITAHQSLDGYATTSWVNEQGYLTGVSIPASSVWTDAAIAVIINSAQWAEGGVISSYTTTLAPYGAGIINSLNEKFISAFISNSADRANFANNANSAKSANYAETVNETYLENKGFTRNLSSEYGTISVINNNIIESTNSAIVRTVNEKGFVSSFSGYTIGPVGNGTATYSWDKSLPNTTINLGISTCRGETLTYSANTDLTGEIVLPQSGPLIPTINIPNATEFKLWANNWIYVYSATVSAADTFDTVVGELAWASALPTYEYDTTNKISAINGSALAGGSEVPSGTMNVSGLEYNAVNEISAYNGSAIAQYGAEKQWLVHDDTLVHAANSAQYALGVNLSAVAQLLGIDETVLYSNYTGRPITIGSYIDLSESPLNFTEIAIYLNGSSPTGNNIANGYERVPAEQLSSTNSLEFVKEFVGIIGNTDSVHDMGCGYSGTSGTRWTKWYGYSYNVQNKNIDFTNNTHLNIWKVVGIGRKS